MQVTATCAEKPSTTPNKNGALVIQHIIVRFGVVLRKPWSHQEKGKIARRQCSWRCATHIWRHDQYDAMIFSVILLFHATLVLTWNSTAPKHITPCYSFTTPCPLAPCRGPFQGYFPRGSIYKNIWWKMIKIKKYFFCKKKIYCLCPGWGFQF